MENNLANNSKLYDFFLENLQEVLGGEQTREGMYKEMESVASLHELKAILHQENLGMSSRLSKLHSILEQLPMFLVSDKKDFIKAFIRESDLTVWKEEADIARRDAALLYCNQKMIFKGIELYGSLIRLAAIFKLRKIERIFLDILSDEQEAGKNLSKLLIAA